MGSQTDFVRADSNNLPDIDTAVILEYFQTSDKHNIAEIRGVKTLMASRDGYVDNSVGYVEIKRDSTTCSVRAKIVPEHKVTKKYYIVTIHLNEKDNTITDTECDGCAASAGGCKHTIVLLFWLEKKAAEPSPTSVECYWKKPRLASEGTQPILTKDIAKVDKRPLDPKDPNKLNEFYEECKKQKIENEDSLILSFLPGHDCGLSKYGIFDMILEFSMKNDNHSFEEFKTQMSGSLNPEVIQEIERQTRKQAESTLWHSIRQGRITGSKIYEICHCNTPDGSLVEQILGGYKVYETSAMKRGKALEKKVLREIETKLSCQIRDCGFMFINLICGASPDGMTDNFVVEIKCPSSSKTVKTYVEGNKIKEKYLAQCQLQMLASNIKKCAFCVADVEFEKNNNINIVWLEYDSEYANNLLIQSEIFWKNNIYPKILQNARA